MSQTLIPGKIYRVRPTKTGSGVVRLLRVQDLSLGPLVDEDCLVFLVDIRVAEGLLAQPFRLGTVSPTIRGGTPVVLYKESLYLMNAVNFGDQVTP